MRPVNDMIEFKQIVGRGTRLYDGKEYFTIYDFVNIFDHFADPEWDGDPLIQTSVNDAVSIRVSARRRPRSARSAGNRPVRARKSRVRFAVNARVNATVTFCR